MFFYAIEREADELRRAWNKESGSFGFFASDIDLEPGQIPSIIAVKNLSSSKARMFYMQNEQSNEDVWKYESTPDAMGDCLKMVVFND